jgi:hypothetical protein
VEVQDLRRRIEVKKELLMEKPSILQREVKLKTHMRVPKVKLKKSNDNPNPLNLINLIWEHMIRSE